MAAHRTFVALELSEAVIGALSEVRYALPSKLGKFNWVAPENLHVTMKFLGDLEAPALRGACEAATQAAAGQPAFAFDVPSVQAIPPRGPLRMIWATPSDEQMHIAGLFGRLESALVERGFAPEGRPFVPHITLARVRFTSQAGAIRQAVQSIAGPFGQVQATHLTVFTSELTPQGPIYTPAVRAALMT